MDENLSYVGRPKRIGDRLAQHFEDSNSQAKRHWTLIIQLSNLLGAHANQLISENGIDLTRGEIIVLTCLRLTPEPNELRQSEIANRVLMTSGGVTNICKHLVERGLIFKEKDPDDARGTIYRLADEGFDTANSAIPLIHSAEKHVVSCMSETELETLCELLERVTGQLVK